RHAHGHVQVGRRQNTMVIQDVAVFGAQAGHFEEPGQEVDRNQVEHVHQDDPQEHRERQRRHKPTRGLVGNDAFGLLFDHVDEHFDRGLEAAWYTGGNRLGGTPQNEDDNQAHEYG